MYSGKQLTKVITTTFHKNSVDTKNFSSEKNKSIIHKENSKEIICVLISDKDTAKLYVRFSRPK